MFVYSVIMASYGWYGACQLYEIKSHTYGRALNLLKCADNISNTKDHNLQTRAGQDKQLYSLADVWH